MIDPRTLKVRQFALPGMYNMWCYVFDEWGQGIVGDGTTPNQAWDTPLSGAQFAGRKGLNFLFADKGERPNVGSEWLVSRHFPDDVQGQFIYACVINMNGMPRFTLRDDGAGYKGAADQGPGRRARSDLIRSTDKHFRPVDPQIGPDGALWFGDWANAADRPHAVQPARPEPRPHPRPHLPAGRQGQAAAEAGDAVRQVDRRSCWSSSANTNGGRATGPGASCATGRRPRCCRRCKEWVAKLRPASHDNRSTTGCGAKPCGSSRGITRSIRSC